MEQQALKYAKELSGLYKKEKEQRSKLEIQCRAMEIANRQLQEFSNGMSAALSGVEKAHFETLECLALAAEFKDPETGNHIARISKYSELLARKLNLTEEEIRNISRASLMHDIGKVGVPDSILLKPGKLTPAEFDLVKQHTVIGAQILSKSDAPLLKLASEIAISHHEKWNGKGYPHGLSGTDIPLSGRIVAIVDIFDALTHHRPYKEPYSLQVAREILVRERGDSLDPDLLDSFLDGYGEFAAIHLGLHSEPTVKEKSFQFSARDRLLA